MDIKRVAFETKPVQSAKFKVQSQAGFQSSDFKAQNEDQRSKIKDRNIKREEIAAIVDSFLSRKLSENAQEAEFKPDKIENQKSKVENQPASPVKTIIHELKPQESGANGTKAKAVDFVSEDDVKRAAESGEKIYITAKTIITPSARDLGEEKEIFAKV
jgi:hypothetical protein